jgi:ubiquinone/menaquinone biosynthesis C-methylase UbiE
MAKYDPNMIEGHFDFNGINEWDRLEKDAYGRVQFHIHNHYLHKHIRKGDRVIEIGAGPGRFTIELAKLGAIISVVDISNVQLQLNEQKVREAGLEDKIEWRKKLDILDLNGIPDNEYESVVCYGGPLSYVLERVDQALSEVIRVTKPGGIILTSVMSCLGTYRHLIRNVYEAEKQLGLEIFDELTKTGDVYGKLASRGTNQCHMFRWSEYSDVLSKHPVEILDASAANFLSTGEYNSEFINNIMKDRKLWETFLKWELDFAKEPGAIDGSTHMIAILRKHT